MSKNISNIDKIEKSALKTGIFISFLMALAGWITYYFSGSDAMLLDGNFSFISVFAGIVAIFISNRKHIKTKTFPFGSYVYESLFVLIKGILILGIILVSSVQNSFKILTYLKGGEIVEVDILPVLIYVVFIIVLCFGLYFYYRYQNKKIEFKSSIIDVESKATLIDGFMSLGIGIAFTIIYFLPSNSYFDFLKSIGDSIIVLIMCIVFFTMPLKIIKNSFIELGGGMIQDSKTKLLVESVASESLLKGLSQEDIYISKVGSSCFIILYLVSNTDIVDLSKIENMKQIINDKLASNLSNVNLEIIVRN